MNNEAPHLACDVFLHVFLRVLYRLCNNCLYVFYLFQVKLSYLLQVLSQYAQWRRWNVLGLQAANTRSESHECRKSSYQNASCFDQNYVLEG
jgi:hypothetical protein